jgi:hypothetical protein
VTGTESLDGLRADDSRMGHVAPGPYLPLDAAPALVGDENTIAGKIRPVSGEPMTFTASALIRPGKFADLKLVPFYRIHDARYVTYWRITTPERYEALTHELAKAEKARIDLDARTLDRVTPGEQQPEVEHDFAGEDSATGSHLGRLWRDASGWFSYQLKLPQNALGEGGKVELRLTYFGAERDRHFDVLVNDMVIASVAREGHEHDRFVEEIYPIPSEISQAAVKSGSLTVKFVAKEKSRTAGIYDVRLVNAAE